MNDLQKALLLRFRATGLVAKSAVTVNERIELARMSDLVISGPQYRLTRLGLATLDRLVAAQSKPAPKPTAQPAPARRTAMAGASAPKILGIPPAR